jgi:hypothetical protein
VDPVQHLVIHGFTCRSRMADRTQTKTRRALPPQRVQSPIVVFLPILPVGSRKKCPKNRKRRTGRAAPGTGTRTQVIAPLSGGLSGTVKAKKWKVYRGKAKRRPGV